MTGAPLPSSLPTFPLQREEWEREGCTWGRGVSAGPTESICSGLPPRSHHSPQHPWVSLHRGLRAALQPNLCLPWGMQRGGSLCTVLKELWA